MYSTLCTNVDHDVKTLGVYEWLKQKRLIFQERHKTFP